MNKNKITITDNKSVNFLFNKESIEVTPISLAKQVSIIKQYIVYYFFDGIFVDNYFNAEWTLILSVVDACTNVPIIEESDNVDLDYLITSGLWEQIKAKISNYDEFRTNLNTVVKQISEQKALNKSLGVVFDKLVDQLFLFFDKIGKLDLSEEGIKNLLGELKNETSNFNEKFNMNPNREKLIQ
jgi:hypothetical protein